MKVLVVDDEPLARERLLRLLARVLPEAVLYEAAGGDQALALVEAEGPELLLLDIRMPGVDGIQVARAVQALEHPPAIIFCTAYDSYALAAMQQQAVAYLLKPVRAEDLAKAIASAGRVNLLQLSSLAEQEGRRTHISAETHRGLEMVSVSEVRCFLAEQKYVSVCHPGGALLIPDSLKELEQEFGEQMLRVHRNALVNMDHVVGLRRDENGSWRVELDGVDTSPLVSRRHLAQVKERLRQR